MLVTSLNACARAYAAARQTRRQRRRRGARRATFRRRHASWECRAAPQRDVGTAWRSPAQLDSAVVERVRVGDVAERGGLAHATGRAQAHDLPARDVQRQRALARAAHERGADGIDVQHGGGGGGGGGSEKQRAPHIIHERARRSDVTRAEPSGAEARRSPPQRSKCELASRLAVRRTPAARRRGGGARGTVAVPRSWGAARGHGRGRRRRRRAQRQLLLPRPVRWGGGGRDGRGCGCMPYRRVMRLNGGLRGGGGGFAALHGRLHGDDAAPGDGERNLTEGRQRSGVAQVMRKLHNLKRRGELAQRAGAGGGDPGIGGGRGCWRGSDDVGWKPGARSRRKRAIGGGGGGSGANATFVADLTSACRCQLRCARMAEVSPGA
ncbi:NHS-like protein [Gracilaria domingensis]|nr:NHS-like protein [Gracilaria domingensis]